MNTDAITKSCFWSNYQPQKHPDGQDIGFNGCMLDVTDKDLSHLKPLVGLNRVWTVLDTCCGLLIMAGMRSVNAYGFIITEKPWDDVGQFVDDE